MPINLKPQPEIGSFKISVYYSLFPSCAKPQRTVIWQGTLKVQAQAVIMQVVQLCQSRFST